MSDDVVVSILPPERVGIVSGPEGAMEVTILPAQRVVVESHGNVVSKPADTYISINPAVSVEAEVRAPFPIGVPGAGEAAIIVDKVGPRGPAGPQGEAGKSLYGVTIESTGGDLFRPGKGSTIMVPHIFYGDEEVTDQIETYRFIWERNSGNPVADALWKASHAGAYRTIVLPPEERPGHAVFTLKIL